MRRSIVYFGSGPVAARSLGLLKVELEIEAIITKPTTTKMMEMAAPGVPIFNVSNRLELDQLIKQKKFKSQVGVLIDFGIIISKEVIDSFSLGILNSHFSILPQWRGADPISFAILSGQKSTGVSLMLLVEKMDEGPLIAVAETEIPKHTTATDLTDMLIDLSHQLLLKALPGYFDGKIKAISQIKAAKRDERPFKVSYSRKLNKSDGKIDWTKPALQLEREIRAFIDWPKSHATLGKIEIIITSADSVPTQMPDSNSGKYIYDSQQGIIFVATGNGTLCIKKLKPIGKNEMPAKAFMAGYGQSLEL